MYRISKRVARTAGVLAVAVAALVAATVGNSASSAMAPTAPKNWTALLGQVKNLKPAARTSKLHELAAKEGQVNVYSSLSSTVTKPLESAWKAAYPDVKLNLYRGCSEDVTARVLAE